MRRAMNNSARGSASRIFDCKPFTEPATFEAPSKHCPLHSFMYSRKDRGNVCPGPCVSTGAKFPVAPVESAPMLVMSHFLRPPDIILNTFYINSSHNLNRSVTISVPVAMASPSLPYSQSSCVKTFCTVCCTMIYINVKTCVIFFADIVVYIVCLIC